MDLHEFIVALREHYPNIRFLRRLLGRIRVQLMKSHLLQEKLAAECEHNEELKRRTVAIYSKKWKRNLAQDIKKIKTMLKREDGSMDEKLYTDMLFCRMAYGFTGSEYVQFDLAEKSYEQRRTFLSIVDMMLFALHMSDISDLQIFFDKIKTYKHFAPFYKRDLVYVNGQNDRAKYLDFLKKHSIFVKKYAMGRMGEGVELVDINNCGKSPDEFFAAIVKEGRIILEELIEQSEEMASFNPNSVNTVRCVAMTTRSGVIIPYCCLRVGRSGSFVDNASAGGLLALIDPDTGVISSDSFDRNNIIHEVHPDTGVRFKGFQLPEWEAMRQTVTEMMGVLPSVKYVGWDMAHTKNGWVVIEGNSMGQLMAPQAFKETGIRNDIINIMKNSDLMVPLKNGSF